LHQVLQRAAIDAKEIEDVIEQLQKKSAEHQKLVADSLKEVEEQAMAKEAAGCSWPQCSTCTYNNLPDATQCEICGTKAPKKATKAPASATGSSTAAKAVPWICRSCGRSNKPAVGAAAGVSQTCQHCGTENPFSAPGSLLVQELDAVVGGVQPSPQVANSQSSGPASLQAAKHAVRRQGPYVPVAISTVSMREELQELLAELDATSLAEAKGKLHRKIASMPTSTTGPVPTAGGGYMQMPTAGGPPGDEDYDDGGDY